LGVAAVVALGDLFGGCLVDGGGLVGGVAHAGGGEAGEPGIQVNTRCRLHRCLQVSGLQMVAKSQSRDVKNIAEVIVNGRNMGIAWKKPFRLEITEALKAGDNKIEIKVTNLWVNRLIGDAQAGVKNKTTFTTMPFYQATSPLLPSGLLGPVKIISVQ
jgi:hypothetical protein